MKNSNGRYNHNRRERHHVIPLSMWGWDLPLNIVELKRDSHKQIHDKQNLDYNQLRNYRKQMNHLPKTSNEYKKLWYGMLMSYFVGALLLPAGLVRAQGVAIKKLAVFVLEKKGEKIPDEPDTPSEFARLQFWLYLFTVHAFEILLVLWIV